MLSAQLSCGETIRFLVTGATGFIGRHLVQRLLKDGHEVHAIVRSKAEYPRELKGARLHVYDGSPENLNAAVKASCPQAAFHLASLFLAEHRSEDVRRLCESNITFSAELLESLVQTGCRKFVSAGTSWQNFNGKYGTAACLYAATKEAFEAILRFYVDAYPLQAAVLKIYDTYGPNDSRRKLLNLLREAANSRGEIGLSPGEQMIDLLHVEDAVSAFAHAAYTMTESEWGSLREYYLRSGETLNIRQLVELYNSMSEKKVFARWGERPYRAREVMEPWNQGETLPGWKPARTLREGLREFANEALHV
jgi:nucleoside-diphosphate-sugar epimerase